jgi:hypothetical protein
METGPGNEEELRKLAVMRLKKRRDFSTHLVVYLIVNAMLVAIWAITGAGFFWPVFVILGWGIGVAANAWDVYGRRPITEEEVARETERLRSERPVP